MPDIQTEMQKVMQAWEQPYPLTQPTQEPETTPQPETTQPPKDTPMFTKTIGVSEASFNIVRDQPGLPKKEYIRILEAKGFKSASTSSILSQMMKQGLLWADSSGCWYPNQSAYTPLKPSKKPKAHKKVKSNKVITSGMPKPSKEALDAAAEAMGGIATLVSPASVYRSKVDTILDDISLSDAHDLYRQLHRYFGGLPK